MPIKQDRECQNATDKIIWRQNIPFNPRNVSRLDDESEREQHLLLITIKWLWTSPDPFISEFQFAY